MLATIIVDAYEKTEISEFSEALDELCNPCDNYGWASAGIYSFWNYETKEILYIGLAVDLLLRFKQHNGLLPCDPKSCKVDYINEYFTHYDKIGYSIMVQSTLSQPITSKNKSDEPDGETMYEMGLEPEDFIIKRDAKDRDDIKNVEGILLECYRRKNKKYPVWNGMGGAMVGRKRANPGNYKDIVESFTRLEPHLLVSRSTLRELAQNPTYERYENFLHAIRFSMLRMGLNWEIALKLVLPHDVLGTYKEMLKVGYLERILSV